MTLTAPVERESGDFPTCGGRGGGSSPSIRRCIVTGSEGERDALIRFVVDPSGSMIADLAEELPGRGMWVLADKNVLRQACDRKIFSRVYGDAIVVPDDLTELVEQLLVARISNFLGLARRAGILVVGFEKVREALAGDRSAALIQASDGAQHGRTRLLKIAGDIPIIDQLDGDVLSKCLGLENVVHAALARSRLATKIIRESWRFSAFVSSANATVKH